MASLVRVEPSTFRADEAWFVFDDGRKLLRKIHQEEVERGPAILSDHIEPVVSMADGKTYDSKSALYRTYRPDGNPQGVRYECVGNEDTSKFERPVRDARKSIEAVKRAMHDMGMD